jgi:hypothetical protein
MSLLFTHTQSLDDDIVRSFDIHFYPELITNHHTHSFSITVKTETVQQLNFPYLSMDVYLHKISLPANEFEPPFSDFSSQLNFVRTQSGQFFTIQYAFLAHCQNHTELVHKITVWDIRGF